MHTDLQPPDSLRGDLTGAMGAGHLAVVVSAPFGFSCGAVVIAAEAASQNSLSFMQRYGSGIIAVSLLEQRLASLELPLMVDERRGRGRPPFTISVDAAEGITTGISAADRSRTIQVLVDESSSPEDLARPGHIYPMRYGSDHNGYLHHADIALECARRAGLYPGGVATVILNDDGSLASPHESSAFAESHGLAFGGT